MSWTNYDDVLNQLRAFGLDVDGLVVGKFRRCRVEGADKEKRGWYHLHELVTRSGSLLLVGSYGVWHGNTNNAQKIELPKADEGQSLTDEQRQALKRRIAEDRKRAEADRQAEAERAASRATAVWMKCLPTGECDYLARKGVHAHGLRFSETGAMVVPMLDTQGRVHGLQFILPSDHPRRKKTGRDKEFWPAGLAKKGHFFILGTPMPGGIILVAEGYATAASLHEATGLPVIVAFDAGNLLPVCAAISQRYKRARILVCGDDDFLSDGNPGATAASAAAMAVSGAHLLPQFAADRGERKITDFNDLHMLEGLHVVRAQVEARLRHLDWAAAPAAPSRQAGGEGGDVAADFRFDLDRLLRSFTLIYGTETVFDEERRCIIGLGPLRSAAGKSLVRMWLEHPQRRTVLPDQVGFDPTERNAQVVCNLWGGWPTAAQAGGCDALLKILEHLVSGEDDPRAVYQWILRWMAYPIQHPGAKMQTALLIHGPEGTGKNTVFGALRQIYGRYGCIFTQVELESQFNGWSSGKLFGIGNEVVTRAELYHQQGRLRNMITETEWQVNEKNLPARLEQNHCNFVFFSNRLDIAKLDPDDRRYCVIWTPPPAAPALYREAAEELRNGGVAALHHYLLQLDLGDFDEHAKPPMTRSKRELIGLSMDSTERFFQELTTTRAGDEGELAKLCMPATKAQFYQAYTLYCRSIGVSKTPQMETLTTLMAKKPGWKDGRGEVRDKTGVTTRTVRCLFPPGLSTKPAHVPLSKVDWLTYCIESFDIELSKLQEAGVLPFPAGSGGVSSKKREKEPSNEPF